MKKMGLIMSFAMFATLMATASQANAQGRKVLSILKPIAPVYSGTDANGMTMTDYTNRISRRGTMRMALQNPFTPHPIYTYSNPGVRAQRTNTWNQNEAMYRPAPGSNYNNWRWREPTALVVPPTASYMTSYGWGVGQVRSTPIHHQFNAGGSGMMGAGGGNGMNTPYYPSSTDQFGLYPVRAPW